jgi:glycosyltransferase involved in cell wall biosynthesis
MKIGFLSQALPYLPSRGGFRLYGANLLRQFSKRHQIDLVTLLDPEDEPHLDWPKPYCARIETISDAAMPGIVRVAHAGVVRILGTPLRHRVTVGKLLRQLAATSSWDVLHVEGAYAGGLVPTDMSIPKVLSVHDSWTLRCAEMLKCSQTHRERLYYRFLRATEPRFERKIYPRFDVVTVVAEPDREELSKVVPQATVQLISYGTDTEYFRPVEVPKVPNTLVFHSHLGYPPNIEAAMEFANEIFPLVQREVPDAVFHLVGANPAPKIMELTNRPGIRVSANVPDLRPAVCSAAVYVCAIRYGTGLKSKMLEAMAMHMPIVGYPGSIVGLEGVPDVHYLLAQNPQEFAAHVVHLLRSPQRSNELADAARKLTEEKYSWASRAQAYEHLYQQLIESRQRRSGE